jgi:hypothetical protein
MKEMKLRGVIESQGELEATLELSKKAALKKDI